MIKKDSVPCMEFCKQRQNIHFTSTTQHNRALTQIHIIIVVPEERAVAGQHGLVEDHNPVGLVPLVGPALHVGVRARGFALALGDHAQLWSV